MGAEALAYNGLLPMLEDGALPMRKMPAQCTARKWLYFRRACASDYDAIYLCRFTPIAISTRADAKPRSGTHHIFTNE